MFLTQIQSLSYVLSQLFVMGIQGFDLIRIQCVAELLVQLLIELIVLTLEFFKALAAFKYKLVQYFS